MTEIPDEYYGWWRIIKTGTWVDNGLHVLGPALLSLTGGDDRLRMHCLLARVKVQATGEGVSFIWMGAWEFDQLSGTGTAKLGRDGRLRGRISIDQGDDSTFLAERPNGRSHQSPPPVIPGQVASSVASRG